MSKPDENIPSLENVRDKVGGLDYISEVDVRTEGSVVHVAFEGSKAEQ